MLQSTNSESRSVAATRVTLFLVGVLAAFAVYAPHFTNGFVLDDQAQVIENPHLNASASWLHLFTVDLWGHMKGKIGEHNTYYRPLLYVTYRMLHGLAGKDPVTFHLASLVLHIACAFLGARLMVRLGVSRWIATLASVLFMLFPLAGETLFSIAAMNDQLLLLFLILAVYLTVRSREHAGATRVFCLFGAALCTAGSVLSKETGVIVPVLLTMEALRDPRKGRTTRLLNTLPSWSVLAVYLVVRRGLFGGTVPGGFVSDVWAAFINSGLAVLWYARYLVFPYPLTPVHRFPPVYSEGLELALGIAGVLLIGVLVHGVYKRGEARFWASWVVVPLVPTMFHFFSTRQVISGVVVAERYTYVSLLPWCFVVVAGIYKALSHFWAGGAALRGTVGCVLALCISFGIVLSQYGDVFQSNASVFEYAAQMNPDNAFVLNGLAQESQRSGEFEKALEKADRAIQVEPRAAAWRVTRAMALNQLGRHKEAIGELRRALSLEPAIGQARISLAEAYRELGDITAAEREYEIASKLESSNVGVLVNLGTARFVLGDLQGASDAWRRALSIDPDHPEALYNLGLVLRRMGKLEEAIPYLQNFLMVADDRWRVQRETVQVWLNE